MEKEKNKSVNENWLSPEIRGHLLGAGRELVQAFGVLVDDLRKKDRIADLTAEYPYLTESLSSLQKTLGAWVGERKPANPRKRSTKHSPRKRASHVKRTTKKRESRNDNE